MIKLINFEFNKEYVEDQKQLCSCSNYILQEQKQHHVQSFWINHLYIHWQM